MEIRNSKLEIWVAAVVMAAISAMAGEPVKVEPVLEPDTNLLAKIEALPDNTWLKLPPVRTAGDLSWCGKPDWPNTGGLAKHGPGQRNYCDKMAWAPDRKRALFCGANHQAPHYINDVWEYDLAANTWVCLGAPDPQFTGTEEWFKNHAEFKGGVFQTRRGGPMRPCHTWSGLSYDSDKRKLYWLDPLRGMAFFGNNKEWVVGMKKMLGVSEEDLKAQWKPGGASPGRNAYIWSFDPYARQWEVLTESIPPVGEGAATEYIPELKQLWVGPRNNYLSGSPYLYDPEKKTLKDLKANGPGPGAELVTAYDPVNKIVVAVLGAKTHVYSFATNEWKLAQEKSMVNASDARSFFCHDPVAQRFVLYGVVEKSWHLWLYDAKENVWTEPERQGDVPAGGPPLGYYDLERNVTVFCGAGDVYVYRCKRAGKQEE